MIFSSTIIVFLLSREVDSRKSGDIRRHRRSDKKEKEDAMSTTLLSQFVETKSSPSIGSLQYDRAAIGAKPLVCPDTRKCPEKETTIFRIQGGDAQAAFASIFFLYVVNGVQYAWYKGYVPWIDLDPSWLKKTMPLPKNAEHNLWEDFFDPYCANITQWINRCNDNKLHIVQMPRSFWFPQVHIQYAWPVRAWYYMKCPDACRRRERQVSCTDHKRLLCPKSNVYDRELYASWRIKGHTVASRVHRPTKRIMRQASRVFREFSQHSHPTLAVHARGTDKGHGRRRVDASEFGYTIISFLHTFPDKGRVYLASEDSALIDSIISFCQKHYPWNDNDTESSDFNSSTLMHRIYVRDIQTRSSNRIANFKLNDKNRLSVAKDVLIDILVMSHCEFFVHAASAVSEAVFYLNLRLHDRSVNLEFTRGKQITMPWSNLELFRFDPGANGFRPLQLKDGERAEDFYIFPA